MTLNDDISFVPEAVALDLYAGDGASLQLTVRDAEGGDFPLDGQVTAQVRKYRGDPDALASFSVTVEGNVATLLLTGSQTQQLGEFQGAWDVQFTPDGAEPVTLVHGRARCVLDVTRV